MRRIGMSDRTVAVAVRRRLNGYWKMEAANALFVPAIALYFGRPITAAGAAFLAIALIPTVLLLVVGALYWRAALARLEGDRRPLDGLMRRLDPAQKPLMLLSGASVAAAAGALLNQGWTAASIAALVCAVLAVLEYLNYFVLQLQNFDHTPDLARLAQGRGLRRAHMARDLAAYRKRRSRH